MQEIITELNKEALQSLQKQEFKKCLELLEKAQRIYDTEKLSFPKLQAAIQNNFACYYRAIGKYKLALSHLQSVLVLEQKIKNYDYSSLACTHLNLSAVYCDLKCFQIALIHAKTGYSLLQENDDSSLNSQKLLCLLTLSNLYVQIKHFQEALEVLSSAIKLEEQQPEPKQELINILQKDKEKIYLSMYSSVASTRNHSRMQIQVTENTCESRIKSHKDETINLPNITEKIKKQNISRQQYYFMPQVSLNRYKRQYIKKETKTSRSLQNRQYQDNSKIRIYQYNESGKNNITIQ